jgi:hypothetical protein
MLILLLFSQASSRKRDPRPPSSIRGTEDTRRVFLRHSSIPTESCKPDRKREIDSEAAVKAPEMSGRPEVFAEAHLFSLALQCRQGK